MADRRLGGFEHLLLLAVLRLRDDANGVTIRETIEAAAGRVVSPGAVYTALDRLEERGLVASWLGDPTPQRGGKRRRFYRLQPAGAGALRETRALLTAMSCGAPVKSGSR